MCFDPDVYGECRDSEQPEAANLSAWLIALRSKRVELALKRKAFGLDAYGECRDSNISFGAAQMPCICEPVSMAHCSTLHTRNVFSGKERSPSMKMRNYYQKEIETASREEILKIQNEKIVRQVKYVYDNVPYYRNLMDQKGVKPEDIQSVDDIRKLPFLTKDDLREAYPYGLLGTDLKNCVRIQSTSGTTGKRVVAFYTQKDIDMWEECCARAIVAAGGTNEDVVQVCYGYGLFTGGPGLNGGSHKVGSLTLPMSSGNTDRQIQFMMDLNATILCCTPSYAAFIGESLAEKATSPRTTSSKQVSSVRSPGQRRCAAASRRAWASRPMTSMA